MLMFLIGNTQLEFGMSKANIENQLSDNIVINNDNYILLYGKYCKLYVGYYLFFTHDKYTSNKIVFPNDYQDKNVYIRLYDDIKNHLESEYGIMNEYITWDRDEYKCDKSKWGEAVSMNQLVLTSEWSDDKQRVGLYVYGNNGKVILELRTTDIAMIKSVNDSIKTIEKEREFVYNGFRGNKWNCSVEDVLNTERFKIIEKGREYLKYQGTILDDIPVTVYYQFKDNKLTNAMYRFDDSYDNYDIYEFKNKYDKIEEALDDAMVMRSRVFHKNKNCNAMPLTAVNLGFGYYNTTFESHKSNVSLLLISQNDKVILDVIYNSK